jgi:hypothetical protein
LVPLEGRVLAPNLCVRNTRAQTIRAAKSRTSEWQMLGQRLSGFFTAGVGVGVVSPAVAGSTRSGESDSESLAADGGFWINGVTSPTTEPSDAMDNVSMPGEVKFASSLASSAGHVHSTRVERTGGETDGTMANISLSTSGSG